VFVFTRRFRGVTGNVYVRAKKNSWLEKSEVGVLRIMCQMKQLLNENMSYGHTSTPFPSFTG
jgi:hypothetical protein